MNPGTRRRKCGNWWQKANKATGKGKGQGHGIKHLLHKKTYQEALMESPPGLSEFKPLKKTKEQQTAADPHGM